MMDGRRRSRKAGGGRGDDVACSPNSRRNTGFSTPNSRRSCGSYPKASSDDKFPMFSGDWTSQGCCRDSDPCLKRVASCHRTTRAVDHPSYLFATTSRIGILFYRSMADSLCHVDSSVSCKDNTPNECMCQSTINQSNNNKNRFPHNRGMLRRSRCALISV